jgi:hypothetical protein
MKKKGLRTIIAHELGHLFTLAIINNEKPPIARVPADDPAEPVASIFGIFATASKNDFYRNVDIKALNYQTWDEMEKAFVFLKDISVSLGKKVPC